MGTGGKANPRAAGHGAYMPQIELDKVDGYTVQSLAEKLFFLYRDDVGTLPQEWTVNGTLHAESITRYRGAPV